MVTNEVREWRSEEFDAVFSLLSDADISADVGGFDPEGPLSVDCGAAQTIQESYDTSDGGVFLVAESTGNNGGICGTAGVIVGTRVSYARSGASVSTPEETTAAARRVVALATSSREQSVILRELLRKAENHARRKGAEEMIALAFPLNDDSLLRRPDRALLEEMGYLELPAQLGGGVAARQYGKPLVEAALSRKDDSALAETGAYNGIAEAVVAAILTIAIIAAVTSVGTLMGLDVDPLIGATDNRGIGAPLTTQELGSLLRDETLQRTDIDGSNTGETRQWQDLNAEEQREEAALMNVISGKDVRLK